MQGCSHLEYGWCVICHNEEIRLLQERIDRLLDERNNIKILFDQHAKAFEKIKEIAENQ